MEDWVARDAAVVWHGFTQMDCFAENAPLIIERAEGRELIDVHGRRYLDAISSLWVSTLGHRVPELDQALREQLDKVAHSTLLGNGNRVVVELAEALARVVPVDQPHFLFASDGASAVEQALKIAFQYWTNQGVRERTTYLAFGAAYILVTQANDRMQAGRLLTPAGSSARDSLVEARRLDPTDTTVGQATREFSAILTEEARKLISAGKLDEAQNYILAAKPFSASASLTEVERALNAAMRSGSSSVASTQPASSTPQPNTTAAVTTPRRAAPAPVAAAPQPAAPGVDSLIAEVRQRLNDDKLIEPPGDSARDALVSLRNAAPNRPEVEEFAKVLSNRLLDKCKAAMRAKAYERSMQLLTAAREVGARVNDAAVAQVEAELTAARDENSLQASIVSAANLKRTKIVAALYPESARKRRIEGWVELAFTIQPNGAVEDVEVQNASPADVFEDAAVRAVRQWRYEPVTRNGVPVAQRAIVRYKFAL